MGFGDWVKRSAANVNNQGYQGLKESTYEVYTGAWRYLGWHVPRGTNVYELDWDVLVILDACRVDLMEEVGAEFPFIESVESVESVGSMSEEWLAKTFTEDYHTQMRETAYVTTNVFSHEVLDSDRFELLDELWRYCWDDDLGTVPPSAVSDRAIQVARDRNPEYLIIHYMQPHHPFVGSDLFGQFGIDPFGDRNEMTVVDALRLGKVSREDFWNAYRDTLRHVLQSVSVLLTNIDANTVAISSDHGEAIGEWGVYGHPAGCLHPSVKNVPWVETTATDTGEYEPTIERTPEENVNVERRLRDLGYM